MSYTKQTSIFVPLTKDGQILIQDRRTKPGSRQPFGFFGGKIDAGETIEEACLREVKEELTYEYTKDDLFYVGNIVINENGMFGLDNIFSKIITSNELKTYKAQEGKLLVVDIEEAITKMNLPSHKLIPKIVKEFHRGFISNG